MTGIQFLTDLYQGSWNAALFDSSPSAVDDAKIADILQKYRDMVGHFPPLEIEASEEFLTNYWNGCLRTVSSG